MFQLICTKGWSPRDKRNIILDCWEQGEQNRENRTKRIEQRAAWMQNSPDRDQLRARTQHYKEKNIINYGMARY